MLGLRVFGLCLVIFNVSVGNGQRIPAGPNSNEIQIELIEGKSLLESGRRTSTVEGKLKMEKLESY